MPSRWKLFRVGCRRTFVVAPLLIALACSGSITGVPAVTASRADQEPAPSPDPLVALNDAFRSAYRQTREAMLARSGPVILTEGDNLVLKKGGQRIEAPYTPPIYHVLKSFAHIPLALDVILANHASAPTIDESVAGELRRFQKLLAAAEATIGSHGLDAEQIERQRKIIRASVQFLDSVVEARKCPREDRQAFARRMNPLVMANVGEAARAELDALHRQVMAWKSQMTEEEWKGLSVVILGSALPRKGSLTVQYFARLLGEPGEGKRITYAESIRDEAQALDLMGTRAVNSGIGVDFFNDPLRMHRDLLSDAARDYLPLLIDRP